MKKILFTILTISLIFILFFMFNSGLIHSPTLNDNNQINNSNLSYIENRTYAENGVTFNYPAEWKPIDNLYNKARWGVGPATVAFEDPSDPINETYFYIKPRYVNSLEQQMSTYRVDIANLGQEEVSSRNITVNGMRAVELIKSWYKDGIPKQALTVHYEVVPGSVYYRFGGVTTLERYNETLPKFELVVYSFQAQ